MRYRRPGLLTLAALVVLLFGFFTYRQAQQSALNTRLIRAIERSSSIQALMLMLPSWRRCCEGERV